MPQVGLKICIPIPVVEDQVTMAVVEEHLIGEVTREEAIHNEVVAGEIC